MRTDGPGGFIGFPQLKKSLQTMNLTLHSRNPSLPHTKTTYNIHQNQAENLSLIHPTLPHYTDSPLVRQSEDPTRSTTHQLQPGIPALDQLKSYIPADHQFTVHEYPTTANNATVRVITHPPQHHTTKTPIRVHVDGGGLTAQSPTIAAS